MLSLTSNAFEESSADLNAKDIAAVCAVLSAFKTPQVAIYNCGVNASSYQSYKRMQIFPVPDPEEHVLWPSRLDEATGDTGMLSSQYTRIPPSTLKLLK